MTRNKHTPNAKAHRRKDKARKLAEQLGEETDKLRKAALRKRIKRLRTLNLIRR